ncbi:cell envelope integrity protein CreD [Pseudoxanthomonas koreensis]|uniref:cell envelope integrity protein CreD n=1 Tax=Pseudoxanthomonas koreensis TaxID=266061 RepID=UPI001391182E|nr:cell envelope integrity protein CreD [Pseudoxanthomonas koreensis]KAF1691437.1 cell envelope integrity protein CreD [Pseudoxanthomonas koreensis]
MKSLKLLLRFLTVGGLVLLLLIPLSMIRGLVHDRERYREQAVERVSQSMAGPQQLVGPLRVVPWKSTRRVNGAGPDGRIEVREETGEGFLLQAPATLQAGGPVEPGVRRIGLHEVRVFQWKAQVAADFAPLPLPAVPGREYGEPYLVLGLGDVRGLVGTPVLQADASALQLQPGTGALSPRLGGMHARLPLPPRRLAADGVEAPRALPASKVRLQMALAGTRSLGVVPVADSNHIELASGWPHLLFGGRFPASARGEGSATWNISSLASGAQAQLQATALDGRVARVAGDDSGPLDLDSVELSLVEPVDVYTKVDRATKYGLLFVVLTFVGFALFELVKQLRIHPLQYLLVGLALAIFFLLLLSLSEHIAFWQAYLVAAAACIGLQFVYLSGVLRSWWHAGLFAAMLTALYGALYSLLVSEDNALLMGSLLLFGILAAIMGITRKVDWYERAGALG